MQRNALCRARMAINLGMRSAPDYGRAHPRKRLYWTKGRVDPPGSFKGYQASKMLGLGGVRVQETGVRNGAFGADKFGFKDLAAVHWNLTEPTLYEHAISAGEASIVAGGALSAF